MPPQIQTWPSADLYERQQAGTFKDLSECPVCGCPAVVHVRQLGALICPLMLAAKAGNIYAATREKIAEKLREFDRLRPYDIEVRNALVQVLDLTPDMPLERAVAQAEIREAATRERDRAFELKQREVLAMRRTLEAATYSSRTLGRTLDITPSPVPRPEPVATPTRRRRYDIEGE